jgi:hypothetical protein
MLLNMYEWGVGGEWKTTGPLNGSMHNLFNFLPPANAHARGLDRVHETSK